MPELPGPDSKHPARLASWRSIDAVARGDKRAWLDNFADDALVEDPIGKSMIDPTGEGHRGPAGDPEGIRQLVPTPARIRNAR